MYMEEQMINGVLCVRYGPHDEFKPYSLERLSERVMWAEKRLQQIRIIAN